MHESANEWFDRFPDLGKTPVFTLRIALGSRSNPTRVIIRAYEGPVQHPHGHTTLFCELDIRRPDSSKFQRLFARERFYAGVPAGNCIDSDDAKELAMSLFAMKPGDTDAEFFEGYTPEQLDFGARWGEELSMVAEDRYGSR